MDKKRLNPPPEPILKAAYFYNWDSINRLCSAQLSGFFHKPVQAWAIEDDFSADWELELAAPITREELHQLLNALQASGYDWDANDCGEELVWGFSKGLSEKLIARTISHPIETTLRSDDGIWLICGKSEA